LCSASWIHYWTDFDDFGLQMTVKEWSMILPRKNWGFQNASLQKMQFFFRWRHSARQTNLDIFWVPEKFWKPTVALPLFVDLFIQIVDTSALRRGRTVSSIFVILKIKYWFVTLQTIRDTASQKKKGGGGGGGGEYYTRPTPPGAPYRGRHDTQTGQEWPRVVQADRPKLPRDRQGQQKIL